MEAVPKLPMISFDLKASAETTHFGPKLKQYIGEAYREDPDSYGNEIHQLEGLRATAVRPALDASGLTTMTRYFCQLRAMQSRFPMSKGQPVACTFVWRDLYASLTCSMPDIRCEMACILYNIGALHTQLAAAEARTTPESLKAACTHYQNAAWAFLHSREHYPQPPGMDICTDILRFLQEICFAQAQECILDKSIQDTRKPSVVGAVATQVLFFYRNSIALLGPSTGTDNIHEIIGTKLYNYWYRYLSFKVSYIGCIVCLYQGLNAEEQQKMGERVAFYQQAVDKLAEARKLAKYIEPVQVTQEALTFTNDVVEGKRKAAKNENEFIYHEEVPDKDLLLDLKPVCLVKPLPINFNDKEVSGPDIFSRLVPIGAHEASSVYSEEKAKLLRHVVSQAEAKNTELTEFMSSLQLDQLDVMDSDQKMPQEIVDRCAAMNAKSDIIQTLVDSMNSLAEIISDVEHSLADIKSFIHEETLTEKDYQKVMGPRPPSIVQTELSREFHKYQEAHTRTNESNQVLHKAMTLHIANLRLLAQPLDVLCSKIPSIDNIEGLDRDAMTEMRRVVGKAREMQTQRDSLIQELRDAVTGDDITPQLLARSTESADDIFKQELEKHTPKVKIIEQNLAAQENIINRLTSLYASYGESRRMLADVLRKRDGIINALITSYDTYEELLGKSQKGLEFYKKLSSNVGQLLTRLRGTCQVHEEERAQMLAKQNTKAATPVPTPPASVKLSDTPPPAPQPATPGTGTLKLKDYLPYMKSRGMARNATPQAQVESIPSDAYYPESIYPTSVRPTPVGSEASDLTQMKLPDGVVMPSMQNVNPYNRYTAPFAPNETDPYSVPPYAYPATSKGYEKPDDGSNYGYATSYTPPQFSTQVADPQYSNPYYSGTQNNSTIVTDSQIPISNGNQASMTTNNQYVYNDPYAHTQMPQNHMGHISESMSAYSTGNQMTPELNTNFAQMHVTAPKSEPMNYGSEYSNTFYNVQYPQVSTPNMATYSHAIQNSNTNIVTSQSATDYNSLHYPYSTDPTNQYAGQANVQNPYVANQPDMSHTSNIYVDGQSTAATNYSMPDSQYGYTGYDQGYTLYTNTDSAITSTTSMVNAPLTTSVSAAQPYSTYSNEPDINFPNAAALSQLDAMDTPIKSHVTGEALSNINYASSYQSYDQNAINYPNPMEQNTMAYNQTTMPANEPSYPQTSSQTYQVATSTYAEQTPPVTYAQSYQNHPGYAFNVASGGYDYDYGSQKSYTSYGQPGQPNMDSQAVGQEQNWNPHGVYTSAGACETVQSPSAETPQMPPSSTDQPNSQIYYNTPYGYITAINQSNDVAPASLSAPTNYGADMNQSTYMQSGQKDTSVTYSSNQVSSPIENVTEPPNFDQNIGSNNQNMATINQNNEPSNQNIGSHNQNSGTDIHNNVPNNQNTGQNSQNYGSNFQNTGSSNQNVEPINQNHGSMNQNVAKTKPSSQEVQDTKSTDTLVPEPNPEPTTFDLLSDIDFTVEVKPLMPEIKVPQISENAIKKPVVPKMELIMKPVPKEEVIERPAKMDLFSDPSLMNKFTQEVKNLQKLTDSLTNKTAGGLTVLDSKWKNFQDVQAKENMNRSKRIATQHSGRNVLTDVVPFDDSRLTLKSDPDAYINASYYKQLASWCIPLVISKSPTEREYRTFWRAVLENKISCVVCLLSDIEMQGKTYWPTAIGQSLELSDDVKVTLEDVACTVHWTERKLHVARGKTVLNVTHYQINVFPAKIVCSPLVLLADKILNQTYDNRLSNQLCGAWLQCGAGAGRSAVLALLTMAMCQVRAGQLDLCDMLDTGCINLCKNRTNVLEDTKYLADAYRTVLFYVQGVLCSGTTMFNGEAVSMPTGASVLPPVTPTPTASNQKPQKFSRESFEEMKQSPGLTSGDMKDPLNFLDPLWSLKKK